MESKEIREFEELESRAFMYDDDTGFYNGGCYGIYYREPNSKETKEAHVYAVGEEEAIGAFLMAHPGLNYDNIIDHMEL